MSLVWQSPTAMRKCYDYQGKDQNIREIVTPVYALARNDILLFLCITNQLNNNLSYKQFIRMIAHLLGKIGRNVVLTRFDGLHTFRVVCYLHNIQTALCRPPGKPHHYTGEEKQI